ncbi:hypothetical protein GCM10007416_15720 [Kroppenstedtia guangzhouensis]|jgi:hypothetical protein|uniref:Uncharacterized protein n=1 Tax=Kroppenstedtia guangzhouensis TaxID=1274356 RepID=A0ABQ1GGY7_9BACL|nr:hypothetical protein [Kroppenstedtia guangzhouensis]GGA43491.1 hypothetical protein GCM10007416_15720 [Kroppenstedtia guangzhouensis]
MRQLGSRVDTRVGVSGYRVDVAVIHPEDPEETLGDLIEITDLGDIGGVF